MNSNRLQHRIILSVFHSFGLENPTQKTSVKDPFWLKWPILILSVWKAHYEISQLIMIIMLLDEIFIHTWALFQKFKKYLIFVLEVLRIFLFLCQPCWNPATKSDINENKFMPCYRTMRFYTKSSTFIKINCILNYKIWWQSSVLWQNSGKYVKNLMVKLHFPGSFV